MKILIADDSKFSRVSLINMIKEVDTEIETVQAVNGQEAVAFYESEQPDLVFLDLTMPVMTGYEALEKIVALDSAANVIILTADIQEEARKKVKASGAKMMINKPIKPVTIASIIKDFSHAV